MKTCTRCEVVKNKKYFSKNVQNRDCLSYWGTQCHAEWRQENRESIRKSKAIFRKKNPGHWRRGHLRNKYGITPERVAEMLKDQGGTCAICGSSDPKAGHKSFSVDHDHDTGLVRGMLCFQCNVGLGNFGHSIEALEKAVAYLSASRRKG
jgi:hypothetical protein